MSELATSSNNARCTLHQALATSRRSSSLPLEIPNRTYIHIKVGVRVYKLGQRKIQIPIYRAQLAGTYISIGCAARGKARPAGTAGGRIISLYIPAGGIAATIHEQCHCNRSVTLVCALSMAKPNQLAFAFAFPRAVAAFRKQDYFHKTRKENARRDSASPMMRSLDAVSIISLFYVCRVISL